MLTGKLQKSNLGLLVELAWLDPRDHVGRMELLHPDPRRRDPPGWLEVDVVPAVVRGSVGASRCPLLPVFNPPKGPRRFGLAAGAG